MLTFIDFYADWCGPCLAMKPVFDEVKKEYAGRVEFRKVDVETDGALAAKYGVMSIPTFVIEKNGSEVARKIGAVPKDVLKSWLNAYL